MADPLLSLRLPKLSEVVSLAVIGTVVLGALVAFYVRQPWVYVVGPAVPLVSLVTVFVINDPATYDLSTEGLRRTRFGSTATIPWNRLVEVRWIAAPKGAPELYLRGADGTTVALPVTMDSRAFRQQILVRAYASGSRSVSRQLDADGRLEGCARRFRSNGRDSSGSESRPREKCRSGTP